MARPPRLQGFDYRGPYRYLLTFCTFGRRRYLEIPDIAAMVTRQILRTSRHEGFAVLAYCLMPDHVHLLVEGRTLHADLRRFVKRVKQSSGQIFAATSGGRLWDEGYRDRVLRKDTDVREVARYIVWNPVRAGLTSSPGEYPYVGSPLLSIDELTRG